MRTSTEIKNAKRITQTTIKRKTIKRKQDRKIQLLKEILKREKYNKKPSATIYNSATSTTQTYLINQKIVRK